MDRETAIQEVLKEQEDEAQQLFKSKVRNALADVCRLSNDLQSAKKRLLDLNYESPKKPDFDL